MVLGLRLPVKNPLITSAVNACLDTLAAGYPAKADGMVIS